MRYLIDTHVLIWLTHHTSDVPKPVLDALYNPENSFYVSIVSLWEMAIKQSLKKLKIAPDFLHKIESLKNVMLPLNLAHIQNLLHLPHHHGDPFDRLLIAQALCENLTIVTQDRKFQQYDAKIMLA